jgi:hypothetical protein
MYLAVVYIGLFVARANWKDVRNGACLIDNK